MYCIVFLQPLLKKRREKTKMKDREYGKDVPPGEESAAKPGRVGCYRARLDELRVQMPLDTFDEEDRALVGEIHRIIAEMSILPEECDVQIDGAKLPAGVVSEVYRELTDEHVRAVIEGFAAISKRIVHRKSYLRTALYNAVLEYSSGEINQERAWGFEPSKRTY